MPDAPAEPHYDIEVSVIIPALEATSHALRIVKLLAEQEQEFPFEVLLVLNHEERPVQADLPPRARILFCPEPGSFAARNAGIRAARGRVLAFTDSDCTPHARWLAEGYAAAETTGFNMMIGGRVALFHERRTAASIYDGAFYLDQERAVRFGTAVTANFWLPVSIVHRVGPFRPEMHGAGDGEFCRRAGRAGYAIVYCETAIVLHPTRWRLSDLLQKERRIAGAARSLRETVPDLPIQGEFGLFRRRIRRINESIRWIERPEIYAVASAVFAVRWAERLLVAIGKEPTRL